MLQVTDARTAQAWSRALERVLVDALDVSIEPISGEAFIESSTRPGVLYAVSATSCTCKAGQLGRICKHRAAYLAQVGELALPETVTCIHCTAGKVEEWGVGHVIGSQPCDICGGTGRVPALPTPGVTPTVVIVAGGERVAA
jgi:hypothetical protein